jgi:diaminopropionate ammonia-lyase
LAGCRAEIYIHQHVSSARETAMANYGANVTRVNGNYEASLAACKADAEAHGWHIVSDTSWTGYRNIPLLIMAGYTLMGQEVIKQLGANKLTHCFLPVGVGGLAGGIVAPIWQQMNADLPRMISVESHMSACFLESIAAQTPTSVDISEETLMAGLSCGEVSALAWELLQPSLSHCLAIDDAAVAPLMAKFADGTIGGMPIEAGECATSGLAALLAAKQDPQRWQQLGLSADSVILLIGTEGATDADIYEKLTAAGQS